MSSSTSSSSVSTSLSTSSSSVPVSVSTQLPSISSSAPVSVPPISKSATNDHNHTSKSFPAMKTLVTIGAGIALVGGLIAFWVRRRR
jgi:hypothetical protein